MPPEEKERGLHPERTAAVCQQDFESRKIDRNVIHIHGIAVLVSGTGKDGCPRVKHHWDPIGFGSTINDFQFLDAVQIIIRKQELVRRMNLDHADPQPQNLLHISEDIRGMPRMQAAAREQPLWIFLHIICDELVYPAGEADHLRSHVVDEHGAVDAAGIKIFRKALGELQHSAICSKFGRFFFMSSSAWGLNISSGEMWI